MEVLTGAGAGPGGLPLSGPLTAAPEAGRVGLLREVKAQPRRHVLVVGDGAGEYAIDVLTDVTREGPSR